MAKNIAFKAYTEGSSWADDDDELDAQPFIIPSNLPEVAEKEQPEEEAPARRDDNHDKHADNSGRGARQERNYDDRRGGHHADRRGGYHDDQHYERDSHRSQRGGRDGGDYAERPKNPLPDRPPYKLYVGNLPFQMNEDDVADFLGDTASIADIHFPLDRESNRPKGFAYVEFNTREALVKALERDGMNAGGRAVKIDVASERRQERSGGFFDKREGRPSRSHDREERAPPAARERPHFALLPRSNTSTETSDGAKKASIFGDAKPRDELVYIERQKAKELERKKEKEAARKKEKELTRKKSVDDIKPDEGEKKQGPPSRKNSHDDGHGFRAVGRGSARGGRGDRLARADGRGRGGEHGGRGGHAGRGGEHGGRSEHGGRGGHAGRGGRGGREGSADAKKEPEPAAAASVSSRKSSEPRAKRVEPVKVKLTAPAPVKNVNAFSALDLDSDSD